MRALLSRAAPELVLSPVRYTPPQRVAHIPGTFKSLKSRSTHHLIAPLSATRVCFAVAAILAGKTNERVCTVTLPGGDLEIEWRKSDGRLFMTGPADFVFSGVY